MPFRTKADVTHKRAALLLSPKNVREIIVDI